MITCPDPRRLIGGPRRVHDLPPGARHDREARRTSTVEQVAGLEAQQRELSAAGVERVFAEQTSSVGPRKALEDALDFVRNGTSWS